MKHGPTQKPKATASANSVLTSSGNLIAREPREPSRMRKQETAMEAGALIDNAKKWKSIHWTWIRRQVRRLQVRIAKAAKENRWNRVKALEYLLTRSRYAKLLAVKRATSNKLLPAMSAREYRAMAA